MGARGVRQTYHSDETLLWILELRDQGKTALEVGRKFGLSKGQVIGLCNRIRNDTERSQHDGTLPTRWWVDGLEKQCHGS